MSFTHARFKDFLMFKGEVIVTFGPGVNVLIGSNATGKTTLLKCLYYSTDTLMRKVSEYFDSPELAVSNDDNVIARIGVTPDALNEDGLDRLPPVSVFIIPPKL